MIRLFLLLLCIPAILNATELSFTLSSEDVRRELSCYEEEDQILELNHEGRLYQLEMPFLVSTPIINKAIVCRKFLEDLPNYLNTRQQKLVLELTPTKSRERYHLENTELIKHCADLRYCRRDVFDYLRTAARTQGCYPHKSLSELLDTWKPSFKTTTIRPVPQVNIELFPFSAFSEKIYEYTGGGDIYSSTMSLGGGTLKDYSRRFNQLPDRLFMMMDAGLAFSTGQAALLTTNFTPQGKLFAVPLTSGHQFQSIHHWKFIFNERDPDSSLSSMNFSTPEKTNFIDAIYNFTAPEIKEELNKSFRRSVHKQCQHKNDFLCLSEFAGSNRSEIRKLNAILERSCEALPATPSGSQENNYFLQPQTADLSYVFRKFAEEAENEIIIITHKFRMEDLYQELLEIARKKKVKVYLYVTSPPPFETQNDGITYVTSSPQKVRKIPDPHLKVMVVDRKKLWFGTGNFTYNAFNQASELYAQTADVGAIRKIMEVAAVLNSGFSSAPENLLQIESPADNWLALNDLQADYRLFGHTITEKKWLSRYLLLNQTGKDQLSRCGLEHLLIVQEEEFKKCLNVSQGTDLKN